MCGRTACTLAPDEIRRASSYRDRRGRRRQPRWRDGDSDKYKPSYNKSPQSMSPVLLSKRHFNTDAPADKYVLALMRWGLVPSWFGGSDPGKMQYSTSNCRSENIMEKKSYKSALNNGQRCVILADGFYEWKKEKNERQPFFIYFPQTPTEKTGDHEDFEKQPKEKKGDEAADWSGWRLLTMAGLFDCWTPPGGGEPLYSYSIITVSAAPNLQDIHDRMPAVLDGEEEVRKWLDFGEVKHLDAVKLLQSKDILTFHPVSTLVNNSRNNFSKCIQPVDLSIKKEAKPTASGKVMMSWLKSSSPSKRKKTEEEQETKAETQQKTKGLHRWFQGAGKKPRTQ